jgi:hypothetical protein
MLEHPVTLEPQPDYPLYVTAKRYWLPSFDEHEDDPNAITLVFLHATSFHKETWEPTIDRLFHLASTSRLKIREAWSIECPNHGQSGILNEKALQQSGFLCNCPYLSVFSLEILNYSSSHQSLAKSTRGACTSSFQPALMPAPELTFAIEISLVSATRSAVSPCTCPCHSTPGNRFHPP